MDNLRWKWMKWMGKGVVLEMPEARVLFIGF